MPNIKEKKSRNPQKTRAVILKAAIDVFEKSGFDGCSIADLVTASGYNKRMIYHYFGDKKGLYRAVFVEVWSELKSWFDQALQKRAAEWGSKPASTEDLLHEALGIFHDFMASHQNYVRLLMWEALEGGEVSRSIWKEVRGPIFIQVEFILNQAKEEGLLSKSLDSAHLVISLMGAVGFYFAYASTFNELLKESPTSEKAIEKRREQLHVLLKQVLNSTS